MKAVLTLMLAALLSSPARADTVPGDAPLSTSKIVSSTIGALRSCAKYEPVGVCFFLRCTPFGCNVETSLRVRHFTPDLVVSIYHDASTHPWDYGRKVAGMTQGAGAAMSAWPVIDAAGTRTKSAKPVASGIYRDADAIGNPANVLGMLLSGGTPSMDSPSSVPLPTPVELMKFFSEGPQEIADAWAAVPQSYMASGQAQFAQSSSNMQSVMGQAQGMLSGITGGGTLSFGESGQSGGGGGSGSSTSSSENTSGSANSGSSSASTSSNDKIVCPPGATPFGLYYLSNLDAFSWRGFWQLEQLYPGTWLPGIREVGTGLLGTWGGVFPRQGSVVQQHPVKGSAVLAQRVADIVGKGAQPHIYAPLQLEPPGFKYFGFQGIREADENHTLWQRLHPSPSTECVAFGSNDSLRPTSYGDGHNKTDRGMVWGMWRRQECCAKVTPIFLGSIPFNTSE
jgi:integrating conjugative element protein (TIGR03756 family)